MNVSDYIIVGAGSAGAVLASRLSEDASCRVLLIEEGPADNHPFLHIPKGFGRILLGTRFVTNYETDHCGAPGGVPEIWRRGKTLGGSSAVNGMCWVHGQRDDYDRLSELGNAAWSWAHMAPYFDRLVARPDHGQKRPTAVEVTTHRAGGRLGEAFMAAGEAMGLNRKDDINAADQEGIGYMRANIDHRGRRVSSARAFLKPARSRANLAVATETRADQLIIENRRAAGIVATRSGRRVEYRARREIILSAGALGSPALLQRSGIGPAAHLQACGVPVVLDSPGVGMNMREHRLLALQYRLRHAGDSQNSKYTGPGLLGAIIRYCLMGDGPLAEPACTAAAFARTTRGIIRPDGQVMFMPYSIGTSKSLFEDKPGMRIFGYVLQPDSQGSVLIRGPNPEQPLKISPNYLSTEHDRAHSVSLFRFMRGMMEQPVWKPLVIAETEETAWIQTDEQIVEAFLRLGRAGLHACGTCAMGREKTAVVDERLRMRGIEGLRIADLSIFPEMLSGNTNAPVMAMALRASDLIIEDRGSS